MSNARHAAAAQTEAPATIRLPALPASSAKAGAILALFR